MKPSQLDSLAFWYSQHDRCPACGGELRVENGKECCRLCLWRRTVGVMAAGHHDCRQDVLDLLVEVQRLRRLAEKSGSVYVPGGTDLVEVKVSDDGEGLTAIVR